MNGPFALASADSPIHSPVSPSGNIFGIFREGMLGNKVYMDDMQASWADPSILKFMRGTSFFIITHPPLHTWTPRSAACLSPPTHPPPPDNTPFFKVIKPLRALMEKGDDLTAQDVRTYTWVGLGAHACPWDGQAAPAPPHSYPPTLPGPGCPVEMMGHQYKIFCVIGFLLTLLLPHVLPPASSFKPPSFSSRPPPPTPYRA